MAGGDGNGWVQCRCGHRHWGRHGAAGLLLARRPPTAPDPGAGADAEVASAAPLPDTAPAAGPSSAGPSSSGPAHPDVEVLLQLRAGWTHQGGTWGVPGGAGDSHESAAEAALREAWEETGVDPVDLVVVGEVVATDHGDWRYTVVIATPRREVFPTTANTESDEVRWVAPGRVGELPLHPGFAASWPVVSRALDEALTPPRP